MLGDNTDDDAFFSRLYNEYMQCRNGELERKLKDVREQKHNLFQSLKEEKKKADNLVNHKKTFGTNYYYNRREITNPDELWPPNTLLIIGDSMLNQMDE